MSKAGGYVFNLPQFLKKKLKNISVHSDFLLPSINVWWPIIANLTKFENKKEIRKGIEQKRVGKAIRNLKKILKNIEKFQCKKKNHKEKKNAVFWVQLSPSIHESNSYLDLFQYIAIKVKYKKKIVKKCIIESFKFSRNILKAPFGYLGGTNNITDIGVESELSMLSSILNSVSFASH